MSTEKPRMNVGIDTGLVNVIIWEQDLEGDKSITVKKFHHSGRGYSEIIKLILAENQVRWKEKNAVIRVDG